MLYVFVMTQVHSSSHLCHHKAIHKAMAIHRAIHKAIHRAILLFSQALTHKAAMMPWLQASTLFMEIG